MTLPAAFATIRMSDINVELGRSSTANISLDTAENGGYGAINTNSASRPSGTNPAAMSEWYGYNHNAAGATVTITAYINFAPTGGSCTINKNGIRQIRTVNSTIFSFSAAAGDEISTTIVSPVGVGRTAIIDVYNNGYVGGNTGTTSTTFTFTTVVGSGDYAIYADAFNQE
jgi:hypothetical protein